VEREHGCFGVAASLPAIMLEPLRRRERGRIDRAVTEGAANVAHRPLHRRQERGACVLEQMPAISDLNRLGPALGGAGAIAAPAIAGDDLDARTRGQPSGDRRRLAVRQQVDDLPPLQIADQCAVPMALAPRPVVDADHTRG